METLLEEKVEATKRPAENREVQTSSPDRAKEINELLRIKGSRGFEGNKLPCPGCTIVVENTLNQCPFCESDITAASALARETTRRLRELSSELDAQHDVRTQGKPKKRGFFERLQYLFEGDPEPVEAPKLDPHAKRLLSNLAEGDTLKVLEEDGPWLMVKTMSSEIGWVYSTVRKKTPARG